MDLTVHYMFSHIFQKLDNFSQVPDARRMQPRFRIIKEMEDEKGRGVVSDWVAKELTNVDRAKIDSRFNQIEINETENPKWIDRYTSLKMWEIRVDSGGKAIRFLCVKESEDVVLLVGCVKRGQIKPADEERANQRRNEFLKGKLNVRNYPLPQRPPDDVEESSR